MDGFHGNRKVKDLHQESICILMRRHDFHFENNEIVKEKRFEWKIVPKKILQFGVFNIFFANHFANNDVKGN